MNYRVVYIHQYVIRVLDVGEHGKDRNWAKINSSKLFDSIMYELKIYRRVYRRFPNLSTSFRRA
jgi:hypothetical protein